MDVRWFEIFLSNFYKTVSNFVFLKNENVLKYSISIANFIHTYKGFRATKFGTGPSAFRSHKVATILDGFLINILVNYWHLFWENSY